MFADGVSEPLPCSYANFIFVNGGLIVPVFNCPQDAEAIEILTKALPDRKIVTLDGSFLIEGGGGIHCMSKQEPL
jgi:agmatine deiminase